MNGKQRFFATLLAVLSLLLLLNGCTARTPASAETEPAGAFYAVQVGKGDALILICGEKTYLIDAGRRIRWGRIHAALNTLGITRLDGVFLTHTDKDHSGGLMPLALSGMEVGAWYAPAYYAEPKKENKHPAVQAAAVRGQSVIFLKAGDTAEGIFTVLAPFELNEENEDENSLVLRVTVNGVTILLTGDMEKNECRQLLESGADISCTVLKVPHHAEYGLCPPEFIAATGAKTAVISTDPEEKPGTPDELVLGDLEAAGMTVLRTDLCAGVTGVVCADGRATPSELALPAAADVFGVTVAITDGKTECITVTNEGAAPADLSGCYFVTLKGEEAFLFPAGTVLQPGGLLTVGTLSTPFKTDLVWNEKNVFSDKKEDGVTLFDACGAPVFSYRIGE